MQDFKIRMSTDMMVQEIPVVILHTNILVHRTTSQKQGTLLGGGVILDVVYCQRQWLTKLVGVLEGLGMVLDLVLVYCGLDVRIYKAQHLEDFAQAQLDPYLLI